MNRKLKRRKKQQHHQQKRIKAQQESPFGVKEADIVVRLQKRINFAESEISRHLPDAHVAEILRAATEKVIKLALAFTALTKPPINGAKFSKQMERLVADKANMVEPINAVNGLFEKESTQINANSLLREAVCEYKFWITQGIIVINQLFEVVYRCFLTPSSLK